MLSGVVEIVVRMLFGNQLRRRSPYIGISEGVVGQHKYRENLDLCQSCVDVPIGDDVDD